ncbi:MAG: fimbrillin family protein [Bacteroidales bacterium]|nr:fimbrillin family protein [Bacteroidales bacterium]
MKNQAILYLLVTLLALVSCAKETGREMDPGTTPMTFSVSVDGTRSSMTTADLEVFYLKVTGPNNVFSYFEPIVKNGEGGWTAARPLLWKDESSSITYSAAWYGALGPGYFNVPVSDAMYTAGADLNLWADQRTQESLNAADLLSMKATTLAFSDAQGGVVPVVLSHALAKLNFVFKLAEGYYDAGIGLSDNPVKDIVVSGIHPAFHFTPLTGEVSVLTSARTTTMVPFMGQYVPGSATSKNAMLTAESVLVPESFAAGALTVYFSVGNDDFDWTNTEAVALQQGKETTLVIDVAYKH